ncbi:exported hypothetical protein [[Clostridium] ultunense Esp]|nr:exported hypothetical protein [[Clostridium] ultunense Esp]
MSRGGSGHSPQQRGPFGGGMHGGMGMMPPAKVKNFRGTLRRLLTYLKPQRFFLIVVFLMALLSTSLASSAEAHRGHNHHPL